MNKILIPKKIVPNLRIEVQSNQREYLPSSLPKKEISASEFGTTMNDILTRIKSELPDSSWVIEMLVANKLINNKVKKKMLLNFVICLTFNDVYHRISQLI